MSESDLRPRFGPDAVRALLAAGPWPIDGGLASELEVRGHDLTGALWSARVLRDDPHAIVEVHRAYYDAGATVAISASYQASRRGFEAAGLAAGEADELLRLSVRLARQARDEAMEAGAGPLLVAASVGPYGATLHDGSEYRGNYGVAHADLVAFHRARLDVLVAAGPDLLAVETVPDVQETLALVEALADHPDVPAWISYSGRDAGHISAGQSAQEAVQAAAAAPSVVAVGINCTAPEHVSSLLAAMAEAVPGMPLVTYPNAGRTWDAAGECWIGEGSAHLPAAAVGEWIDRGALLVGGCCGLGPDAVAQVAAVTAERR